MNSIELKNVGPIERLSIPVPDGGGLIVLRGTNDLGKSEVLDAIDATMTGRGKVEVRRGQTHGEIDAFGVAVKLGRRTTRTGEAVVQSLEGRFSIEDLIQPPIKDPVAADAKRIKTLIQITGAAASPELFYPLLGGRDQFDAVVSKTAVDTTDIVVMADRVKRDLESAARKEESQAEHAEGRARGSLEAASGCDLSVPMDQEALQRDLEDAIRDQSRLVMAAQAANEARRRRQEAIDRLEDAEADYSGPTSQDALADAARSVTILAEAEDRLRDAEEALRVAKWDVESAKQEHQRSAAVRKAAEQHEAMVEQCREAIEGNCPEPINPDQLEAAAKRVHECRYATERGVLARKALQHRSDAERHLQECGSHRKEASRLRTAAQGIDDVLSKLVASSWTPLRVEGGRLIMDTDKGPKTYAERSHGIRSRVALDIAIEAVGEGGVICLKQEFWEGIAPAKRIELANHVKGRGVLVITAQASDDDEIRPEVFPVA